MANVHGGPQHGEGVLGTGRGAIISCHDGISDFGAKTMFVEMAATTTFYEIATMTTFLNRLPQQRNIGRHIAPIGD